MQIRCAHITLQVLEETRLFFDQRLGPNDFTNKGPQIFSTADLGGLIEDIRWNKFLDSVTMPRQCNNQENGNKWATHHGKGRGGGGVCKQMGVFRCHPNAKGSGPLLNAISKLNYRSNTTREGVAGAKPRTPPSSDHQIYGEVTAKICHT